MNKAEYALYLVSEKWKRTRLRCLLEYNFRCQVCGCTSERSIVDVHHLHYRNIGNEHPDDLVPLCKIHHAMIHNQADGYDRPVFLRLQRECKTTYSNLPVPGNEKYVRKTRLSGVKPLCCCSSCHTTYDPSDNDYCPSCLESIPARPAPVSKQNADFFGITAIVELDRFAPLHSEKEKA